MRPTSSFTSDAWKGTGGSGRPAFDQNNSTGDNNEANSSHHRLARCAGLDVAGAHGRSLTLRKNRQRLRCMTGPASTSGVRQRRLRQSQSGQCVGLPAPPASINYSSTGGIAGGEAGYNVQSSSIVLGIEAGGFWSVSRAAISRSSTRHASGASIDATSLRNGVTLLARGSIAVDRLLLFFTGGWAYGDFAHEYRPGFRRRSVRPIKRSGAGGGSPTRSPT